MKIRWLIVALCVMAPNCFAQAESPDLLAADNNAARFRTGEIDPLLTGRSNVTWPDVFSNPRVNLPRLVELLKQNVWNDYHLVKRIHDWLTLYIAYDNDFFYGLGTGTRKPDEFLPLKRTVCGGFAALFVEMCGLAGLQAEYVSGVARSYVGADGDLGGHAWNAVKISGTWYLVDVTHDHRRTYEHGTFGELGPYRDTELFIRPEAKILENLPDESRFQFLTRPRSREEFLRPPRLKVDAVGLGVGWPKQQFESLIRSGKRAREGGKMYSYFDEVSPGRSVVTLRFTHPEWVEMWVNLYDDAEQKHPLHAFISRTADGSEILCSVPGNGRFQVKVSARPSGGEAAWRLVYAFAVIGKNGAGPIVPPPGVVYTRDPFLRYKLEILDQDIDKPFGRGYYRLRIRHPDGVAVGSALRDKDDTNVEGAARVYVTGNVRDYY
ncbi:MAG TPA: hypothetical protein ENN69_00695, partial [Spirochaetia bacterium]|nr:hypothetical protein [Spirochaetia bacterium]